MKILAIGRNYAAHIEELNNERPTEPVVFMKPDTALLENNDPFYYPDFSTDIHFEVELLLKISRTGKYIQRNSPTNITSRWVSVLTSRRGICSSEGQRKGFALVAGEGVQRFRSRVGLSAERKL